MSSVSKRHTEVRYCDRKTGEVITEAIFMESGLRWLYENPLGFRVFNYVLNNQFVCWLHSKWQDRPGSRKKILKFASQYQINLEEAELSPQDYPNFNAFFSRRLKPGIRCFDTPAGVLSSPTDGKVLLYPQLDGDTLLAVKGIQVYLKDLLQCEKTAAIYNYGAALVIRLAPSDYHRFHFLDDGEVSTTRYIQGQYHSVSPIALAKVPDVFCRNQRAVTKLISQQFGQVTYVEIGAFCIGTIIQTFVPGWITKGQEKGYFRFGGSTVVLLFEPGVIRFDDDLIQNSAVNLEVEVKAGEGIAKRI